MLRVKGSKKQGSLIASDQPNWRHAMPTPAHVLPNPHFQRFGPCNTRMPQLHAAGHGASCG